MIIIFHIFNIFKMANQQLNSKKQQLDLFKTEYKRWLTENDVNVILNKIKDIRLSQQD